MAAPRKPFLGRRRVVVSTRRLDVATELEYLEEALEEAEAAERWYAERSASEVTTPDARLTSKWTDAPDRL
jgi:hypothetical protein